ncbi:MAG: epimerase [Cyclobacteriaceae bacterium]|jgi:uncharacterized protein YbjT (DUF2867 family)|nr:epimerase [Cyclobacteriaceae bacterium]
MALNVIITGSTGMVGKGLLLECLRNDSVKSVLIINRKSIGIVHEKLTEVIHLNMFDLSELEDKLVGYNVCYFCLGVSVVGLSESDYFKITHELTLHFARTLLNINPGFTFCYVSGAGTDSTEKGKTMWARIKGKTENDLLSLGFKHAYMFRPAFIQPMDGIKSKTSIYNLIYFVLSPFYFILKLLPKYVTSTSQMSSAMINVIELNSENKILESIDINQLANQ